MVRVIIHGCCGKMGRVLADTASTAADIEVVAGIDVAEPPSRPAFPLFAALADCPVAADVVIDFSSPKALPPLLKAAVARKTALIIATTGLTDEDKRLIAEAAVSIPVFLSANMSLGVNLLSELVQKAASVFGDGFDIEIIEKHHNQKKDAPSGTALLLAEAINEVFLKGKTFVYGRHGRSELRQKPDVGIHAVRAGTIVGEHEVLFAGRDELLELRHSAASRQIFALGALQAARYMVGRPAGLHGMKEMITAASAVTRLYVSDEEALISLFRIPLDPRLITAVFEKIGEAGISIDMISQTAPVDGEVNISFTVFRKDLEKTNGLLGELSRQKKLGSAQVKVLKDITKIAVEGPGMETQSGVAARVFGALAARDIRVQSITTSETKIAFIIGEAERGQAVETIKNSFGL